MRLPALISSWMPLNKAEVPLCWALNQLVYVAPLRWLFSLITRLGDGLFWYIIAVILPLIDPINGWRVSLRMIIAGVIGLTIYKTIKYLTHRARPFIVSRSIHSPVEPLDFYSFPSGHSLHAIGLTQIITLHYTGIAFALWVFAGLICLSRIVLGHHYPTDVVVGGSIGWYTSKAVLATFPVI